ncbi:MAG: hypothetical protein IKL24_01155 [Clostridia bacterium]|nr:hypothetical protein [Clostridia bacterium]
MKSTQNNRNEPEAQKQQEKPKSEWQMPERAQIYVTPGAQKSIDDARQSGEPLKVSKESPPAGSEKRTPTPPPRRPQPSTGTGTGKKKKAPEKVTVIDAVLGELRDRFHLMRLGIQFNSEDLWRGVICGLLLVLFAMLQTTFFVRFAPFSKIPDLMLIFVLAIGVYEGEKWGSVTGLVAAFVIQSLGAGADTPHLLSLIYMPVGCVAGLLSKYYLRHTLPVKALFVIASALLRSVVTLITAIFTVNAPIEVIALKIVLPEYLSTVVMSWLPFLLVWASFRHFHKTRAERTDRLAE